MTLLCEKSCAPSDWNPEITSSYTDNILCFSPLSWSSCELKLLLFLNSKSQKMHFQGFSPVCILLWTLRSPHCVPACASSNCFFLKLFVTKNAFVRLFSRVGHIVVTQITFLGCFLITLGAIHLSMCPLSFFKLFLRGLLLCLTKHMFFLS